MVESFIRWCERGDVGLSQTSTVDSISEEEPTGLYEEFYVDTGRKQNKIMKMIQETNAVGGYCGFYIKYKGKEKLK